MEIAVITTPGEPGHEAKTITTLFDHGLTLLHLRKPKFSIEQTQTLIRSIPKKYYCRIILHYHHRLAASYGLKGVHYTESRRTSELTKIREIRSSHPGFHQSASFHTLEDIKKQGGLFDYVFISPVFYSISKKNHGAAFKLSDLERFLKGTDHKVFALGGINEDRVRKAAALGFSGVAGLGGIWCRKDPVYAFLKLKKAAAGCSRDFTLL